MQTTSRNDLADPFLFRLLSGAAARAVFVITVTCEILFSGLCLWRHFAVVRLHRRSCGTGSQSEDQRSGEADPVGLYGLVSFPRRHKLPDLRSRQPNSVSRYFLDAGRIGRGPVGDFPAGLRESVANFFLCALSQPLAGCAFDRGSDSSNPGRAGATVEAQPVLYGSSCHRSFLFPWPVSSDLSDERYHTLHAGS